jgi:molecular chaperone HscA
MKLFDITEPEAKLNKKVTAIGIDLGTTNSLVAISTNQQPKIIADSGGVNLLPSIVNYLADGKIQVGTRHDDAVTLCSTKRQMGKSEEAVLCAAEILKTLKIRAENHLDCEVTHAVITVPAYFDEAAKCATKDAAKLAGLEVLRLINEPTAAAFAYGLHNDSNGIYLIYDLGGGTFDVSILNMQRGVFQVLATGGDTNLGGDDFDVILAQYLNCEIAQAEKIKRSLSDSLEYLADFHISRAKFEELIKPIIDHSLHIVRRACADAKLELSEIKDVILVGGSTRIPYIKQELQSLFGKAPLDNLNPDEIVALGAALQAENLTDVASNLLIDVNPLSLGVETMGGVVEKIITRNSPIPTIVTKEFTTYTDFQSAIWFHIVQGEKEAVEDCQSLARFELAIPQQPAGLARIKVSFALDADGLLTVTARNAHTDEVQEVIVKPTHGLSAAKIEQILRDAYVDVK